MSTRAFTGLVGPEASRDLLRARAELASVPNDVARLITATSTGQLSSAWAEELSKQPGYSKSQRSAVTANNRVIPHEYGFSAYTGNHLAREFEFGALNREEYVEYIGRRGTTTFPVRRRTKRQMPSRSQTGWIAYPAAAKVASRAAKMWMQVCVKAVHDRLDKATA